MRSFNPWASVKGMGEACTNLTGPKLVTQLVEVLRKFDKDVFETEERYQKALTDLRESLDASLLETLEAYLIAAEISVAARLTYLGFLGLRVNLENFRQPMGHDFLQQDPTFFLKENVAATLAPGFAAQQEQHRNHGLLPKEPELQPEPISYYHIHPETSGRYLSHYAGHVFANGFLPWVGPGYQPDLVQTTIYRNELTKLIGYAPF